MTRVSTYGRMMEQGEALTSTQQEGHTNMANASRFYINNTDAGCPESVTLVGALKDSAMHGGDVWMVGGNLPTQQETDVLQAYHAGEISIEQAIDEAMSL